MSDKKSSNPLISIIVALIAIVPASYMAYRHYKVDSQKECKTNSYSECIEGKWKWVGGELIGIPIPKDSIEANNAFLIFEFIDSMMIVSNGQKGKVEVVDTSKFRIEREKIIVENDKKINISFLGRDSLVLHFSKENQEYAQTKFKRLY